MEIERIHQDILADPFNADMRDKGYSPVFTASHKSKILIVGQAPGRKAQESLKPWNDLSGIRLRQWLGVSADEFYDTDFFALMPMDFFYSGKGKHGDLPPRKGFAQKWHPRLLSHMKHIRLIIPIGAYAQKYYLEGRQKSNLTQTVMSYHDYLPEYFPLVHPSPLNMRWLSKNPWFGENVVPALRDITHRVLSES